MGTGNGWGRHWELVDGCASQQHINNLGIEPPEDFVVDNNCVCEKMDNFMYSEDELVDEWDTLNTAFVYSKPMEGWTSLWVAEGLNQCLTTIWAIKRTSSLRH
jgi:hypothetical protein